MRLQKGRKMKQAEFDPKSRTFYTYRFADGTSSTVHVGDIDENGVVVTEDMIALLYEMDEENPDPSSSTPLENDKIPKKVIKGVYDTLKGKHVNVPVSEEVYDEYMRGMWAIKDQDKKFYAHEIQMSQLIGAEDDNCDNFEEFISTKYEPFEFLQHEAMLEKLREEIDRMSTEEQNLIDAIYSDGLSGREYSKISGIPQKTINNRKRAILRRLRKMLEIS